MLVLESQFNWKMPEVSDTASAKELQEKFKLTPTISNILVNRGYDSVETVEKFLNPQITDIYSPDSLHDIDKAVERIRQAIEAGDQITIYGDYDADGITSTSVMYESLLTVGANVNFYVPNRFTDGYGPNVEAFGRLIEAGTQLIVTVDNGVSGNEAIDFANQQGVDVVVTDHHEIPEQIPAAYAIVHPRFPGTDYPFGDLSGVGVAFKVAWALLEEFPSELLDLVAIGEIADLVSVTDENRVLISFGLKALQQGMRPGLHELVKLASVNEQKLNETNVGFAIAPRLNALGRMDDANLGVELLTTLDEERAVELAAMVDKLNQQRQKIVAKITKEAMEMATSDDNKDHQTLVIAGHDWHEGVLGIVASRIVESTNKPTLVLNIDSETNLAKGSGRSIDGFDLFASINEVRNITTSFGGHQMAVGISLTEANLPKLQAALETAATNVNLGDRAKKTIKIAADIKPDDLNLELFSQIEQLAPFGQNNERPVVALKDIPVNNVKTMGKTNAHLKFEMLGQNNKVNAVAFNRGALVDQLMASKDKVSIVGTLDENEWRGNRSVQLMVKDLSVDGIQVIDQRTSHLSEELFGYAGKYVFFNHDLAAQLKDYVDDDSIIFADEVTSAINIETLTIVDCPADITDMGKFLSIAGNSSIIRVLFYEKHSVYLSGMPTHQEFGELFKFVQSHQNVNLKSQLKLLSDYLKINQDRLIFMIQVFFEADFVKIEDGLLNRVDNPQAVVLEETQRFKQRKIQMETERELIYSDSTDLRNLIISAVKKH